MEILITFSEIQELIKNKTGKDTIFSMVDSKTIRMTYPFIVRVPLLGEVKKDMPLNISIKEIKDTDVHITYDGGMAIDLMISEALKCIKEDPKFNFVEIEKSKQVILKLGQIEQIKEVFDMVEIQSISVTESGFKVFLRMKGIL